MKYPFRMKDDSSTGKCLVAGAGKALIIAAVWILLVPPVLFAAQRAENPGQPQPRLSGEVFRITTRTIGSPFYYDYWSPGVVILKSGARIEGHLLMYDGLMDELIYQHPITYETIIADRKMIREFRLINPGREDVFINIRNSRWSSFPGSGNYFRVLYDGQMSLLVRNRVKRAGELNEYTEDGPVSQTKLKPEPAYFIILPDGRSYLIHKLSRRALTRTFPQQAKMIRDIIRRNNLSLHDEPDFIRAVRIMDEHLNPQP